MAKTKIEPEEIGVDDLAELEILSQGSIQNRHELVAMYSGILDRTVTITRDQVYKYASVMASNSQIAALIGVDKNTILNKFGREIKMGRAFAKQKLLTRFFNLALYGNNSADRIFALKNWAGMGDNGMEEQFDDTEEGIDFKIRRPSKTIIQASEIDYALSQNAEQEFQHEET